MDTATRGCQDSLPLPAERRVEGRTSCHIPIVVEWGGHSIDSVLWDVSPSGAYMECGGPLSEGRHVRIRIPVETALDPLVIGAQVRWILHGPTGEAIGAGVCFEAMQPGETRVWLRYLRSLE